VGDELLGIADDRLEVGEAAIPLDHRELARVVWPVLAGAEALADLEDPLEPRREQALHLIFGRRDQIAATRRDGVEVDL
jgi:hypothetical protein